MKEAHIICKTQHNFRRSVPPGCHVFRHETLVPGSPGGSTSRSVPPRESKITNLEIAVSIDEKISWLEVPMKDIGGMYIFQAAKGLVNESLEVRVGERLSRSNLEAGK